MKKRNLGYFIAIITILGLFSQSCLNKKSNEEAIEVEQTNNSLPQTSNKQTSKTATPIVEDLSGDVQFITEDQFYQKITTFDNEKGLQYKGKTPAIVDFYADWCRPCIALNPVLEELAKKYKGQIIIYKVNVDKAQKLAASLEIQSIPTMFFFKPNAQPGKIVGAPSKIELEKTIKEVLL